MNPNSADVGIDSTSQECVRSASFNNKRIFDYSQPTQMSDLERDLVFRPIK